MLTLTHRPWLAVVVAAVLLLGAKAAWAAPTTRTVSLLAPLALFTDQGPNNHFVTGTAAFIAVGATLSPTANVGPYVSKVTLKCNGAPNQVQTSGLVQNIVQGQLVVLCPFYAPLATSALASLDSF